MKPHFIGIAGPSCSGKGELAHWLKRQLPSAGILDLDSYYQDQRHLSFERRCLMNYDIPAALDVPLLISQVRQLVEGEPIAKPVYSFAIHTRTDTPSRFEPASYILIEGLFTLYWPELRKLLDTAVFIDAPDDVCRQRRLERDVAQRSRKPADVIHQFDEQVLPAANQYVRPTRQYASLQLNGELPWEQNGAEVLRAVFSSQSS